jgi:hypothetical protein
VTAAASRLTRMTMVSWLAPTACPDSTAAASPTAQTGRKLKWMTWMAIWCAAISASERSEMAMLRMANEPTSRMYCTPVGVPSRHSALSSARVTCRKPRSRWRNNRPPSSTALPWGHGWATGGRSAEPM